MITMKTLRKIILLLTSMLLFTSTVYAKNDKQVIPNGVYIIHSKVNEKYVIDVKGGSKSNKTNIQLYTSNKSSAQKFKFEHIGNDVYKITNIGSNKVIDNSGGRVKNGNNIWQYTSNNANSQKWKVIFNSDGTVTFKSMLNQNYVIDLSGGITKNSRNIQLYKSNGSNAQKWVLTDINNKKIVLKTPKKLTLNKTAVSIEEGKSFTLTASNKNVTWTTSNYTIAEVSKTGVVKTKKAGDVKITAKSGTTKVVCNVHVYSKKYEPINRNNITREDINNSTKILPLNVASMYTTVNNQRKAAGKKPLVRDPELECYAEVRAKEITTLFSHTRPDGTRGLRIIPGNKWKGENIARGYTSVKSVCDAWYKSDGHKLNILDSNYTKIGVYAVSYDYTNYWVQLFSS